MAQPRQKQQKKPAQKRQLTEAEIEQRREAARASADARRKAKLPEFERKMAGLTPEQRGAVLFFLKQAAASRKKEIQARLKDEQDLARRAELEGEERSIDDALREDDWLNKKTAGVAEEAKSKKDQIKARNDDIKKAIRALQDQQYGAGFIDRIAIKKQIDDLRGEIDHNDAQSKQIDESVRNARSDASRARDTLGQLSKQHQQGEREQAQRARSERERLQQFREMVREIKKRAAEKKKLERKFFSDLKKKETEKKKKKSEGYF